MDLEAMVRVALRDLPELLKPAEAAVAARCSLRTISRYMARGRLKACKPATEGGLVLVPKEALIQLLSGKS